YAHAVRRGPRALPGADRGTRCGHRPLAARVAKATGAAPAGLVEALHDRQLYLHYRHDHELRDTLARLDLVGEIAAIPNRDHQRSLVIGVDQTDEITEHHAVTVAEPRTRQDNRGQTRILQVNR